MCNILIWLVSKGSKGVPALFWHQHCLGISTAEGGRQGQERKGWAGGQVAAV